jgi:hypothetical protein
MLQHEEMCENSWPHFVRQLFSFCYMMKNILKSLYIHLINLICACFFALVVKSIQTLNEIDFSTFCGYVLYLSKTNEIYCIFFKLRNLQLIICVHHVGWETWLKGNEMDHLQHSTKHIVDNVNWVVIFF